MSFIGKIECEPYYIRIIRIMIRDHFTDLNLFWIKGALALFVLVSGYVC